MNRASTKSSMDAAETLQGGEQFWRRLIFGAVQDAKRTRYGVPTGVAILARWWLVQPSPSRECKEEWERSFACACEMLGRDPVVLRARLLAEIDKAIQRAGELHLQSVMYVQRAMVLACAGVPTAISRQFLLPLVDEQSYEDVAGMDHGDQFVMYDQREDVLGVERGDLTDASELRDNQQRPGCRDWMPTQPKG